MGDGMKRRDFLKVVGASGAGASILGCSTEEVERLIPYVVPPDDITPGVATWYASVCGDCPAGCGIWVRTREGRATKVEGNPDHPVSRGALCARGQSSVQGLYDPDRIAAPMARRDGELVETTWDEAEALLAERLDAARGRVLMLTGRTGPSLTELMEDFVSALGGSRVEHEALSEAPLREATRIAFGRDALPRYDFTRARLVYDFGADFLLHGPSPVAHERQFARMSGVDAEGRKGRMVFFGPRLNLTGQNADDWVPVPAAEVGPLALAMANALATENGASAGPYQGVVDAYTPERVAESVGLSAERIREMAREFGEAGPSLAVGPGVGAQGRNATAASLAVLILNQVAGNVGRTVLLESPELGAASRPYGDMERAIREMAGRQVDVAMVRGTNPAYTLPPGSGFREAFGEVAFKVVLATSLDETAAMADLVLPDAHFLEAWGDSNPRPGVYALQQPVMRPVPHFDSKQAGDVLLSVVGRMGEDFGAETFQEYLRGRWGTIHGLAGSGRDFDGFWRQALRRGVVELEAPAPAGNGANGNGNGTQGLAAGAAAQNGATENGTAAGQADGANGQAANGQNGQAANGNGAGAGRAGAAGGAAAATGLSRRPPVQESAEEPAPSLRSPDAALTFDTPILDGEGMDFTLLVYPSRFGDGSHANRPWLQELPDPVSKITWHSWVEVNPRTAERLDLEDGDVVSVQTPHGRLEVPVWTYPGIREDHLAIPMGGGRESGGRWAEGKGVNPMRLLPAVAEQPSGAMVLLATRATMEPTGQRRRLATVAGSTDQHDRPLAPAVSYAAIAGSAEGLDHAPGSVSRDGGQDAHAADEHADDAEDHGPDAGHGEPLRELMGVGGFVPVDAEEGAPTAYPLEGSRHGPYSQEQPRWAMAIDLDKCTGCSACVTACQAENNVPWVGEEQVMMGREMHWIRLETFYEHVDATEAGPVDVRHLPMLCQHCGNAPCEPVCPVYAAYHTPDGLNAQVYNRCVGTRYCANNCPYKVRVFNWYTYTDVPEPMNWQFNPDVTVRENGVMEKCTFCVQRIREEQNRASLDGRGVRDGDIVPACEATCPAEAIVFGDARDPDSRVSRAIADGRTYRALDELINTQPAVNYQKKVTFHAVDAGHHGGFYGEAHGAGAGTDGEDH